MLNQVYPANQTIAYSSYVLLNWSLIEFFPDSCFLTLGVPQYILILSWSSHSTYKSNKISQFCLMVLHPKSVDFTLDLIDTTF